MNATGGVLTAVVLAIVVSEKFVDGAYLVVILVPVLVAMMLFINRQYSRSARELAVKPDLVVREPHREERVVVPIPGINRAVIQAINVARSIDDDVRAVYISEDPDDAAEVRARFERQIPGIPLVVVESPYRALAGPLLAYLDVLDAAWPPDKPQPITFVVIPEYVARSWWERLLYNQSAKRLRGLLLGRPHTVVVNVPYRREEEIEHPPPTSRHARTSRRHRSSDRGRGIERQLCQVRPADDALDPATTQTVVGRTRPSTVPCPRCPAAGRRPARPRPRGSDARCVPSRFDAAP